MRCDHTLGSTHDRRRTSGLLANCTSLPLCMDVSFSPSPSPSRTIPKPAKPTHRHHTHTHTEQGVDTNMLRTRLYTASVAAVAACRPTLMQHCRRSEFHCSARLASLTGIAFSPVAPAELKVAQWMKAQEIAARRKIAHAGYAQIWAAPTYQHEDWSRLTYERARVILKDSSPDKDEPIDWDINEFINHTLLTKCPWRHAELERERRTYFEQCLSKLMKDLRAESDSYRHGTMMMTKNELTRKLTAAMGKLPSASEVEDAWQDRHTIPAIDWVEDAI